MNWPLTMAMGSVTKAFCCERIFLIASDTFCNIFTAAFLLNSVCSFISLSHRTPHS